jgi:phosphohistidine phosphatase SixA
MSRVMKMPMKLQTLTFVCALALAAGACGTGEAGDAASTPAPTATTPEPAKPDAAAPDEPSCTRGRSYIVVRHAEKASTDVDPSLSERGATRAATLASMLAPRGVTRLVATEYKRTQETLAPLAQRLSLKVEVRAAAKATELVTELRAEPDGALVVVATHSNVLPVLVEKLAGTKLPGVENGALAEDDYSRVVFVTLPCGGKAPSVTQQSSGD